MASSEEDGTNGASEASDEKEATGKRRRLGFLATAWLTFYNIAMTAGYVRAKVLPRSARCCAVPLRSGRGDAGSARSLARSLAGLLGVEPRRARRWNGSARGELSGVETEARDGGGGLMEPERVGHLGVAVHTERGSACPGPLAIGALWARGRGAESKSESARGGP